MQYCCIDPSLIISSCSCFIGSMKMDYESMNEWLRCF
jgi:hypothetical protein